MSERNVSWLLMTQNMVLGY